MEDKSIIALAKQMTTRLDLLRVQNIVKEKDLGTSKYAFSLRQLTYYCNPNIATNRYKTFQIPKKSKGYRTISAPCSGLKMLQTEINNLLKLIYHPSENVMGFVEGKSIVSNAECHLHKLYVLNIDLENFFPSIPQARVWTRLELPPFNFNVEIASTIDADFDDNSSIDKHIYVTPCYSIENLYVDATVVSDILENEYKIRRTAPSGKHEKTLNLFKSELANFHSCILLFNAWYRTIKLKGIDSNNGVNLEDSFPSYLYKYQIKPTTTCKYSIRDIEKMFPKAPKTTAEEIERSKAYLANPKRLRGKYEIQFLYIFLEFLNTDSITAREYTVLHRGITWDRKRMISSLEQYVPTPHDMRSYIKKGIRQKI